MKPKTKKAPAIGAVLKVTKDTEILAARKTATKAKKTPKSAATKTPAQVKVQKSERALGKRAAILAAAQAGKLPEPPDFSAKTHERFRPKLEAVVKLVRAKDVRGLKAFEINPVSTSPKAIARYRDLAVIALTAKAAA